MGLSELKKKINVLRDDDDDDDDDDDHHHHHHTACRVLVLMNCSGPINS